MHTIVIDPGVGYTIPLRIGNVDTDAVQTLLCVAARAEPVVIGVADVVARRKRDRGAAAQVA